jgi:hypothetical protein
VNEKIGLKTNRFFGSSMGGMIPRFGVDSREYENKKFVRAGEYLGAIHRQAMHCPPILERQCVKF